MTIRPASFGNISRATLGPATLLPTGMPVSGGGSVDEYAIRDPLSTDKFLDPNAGSDGTGTEASPWNVFTSAKVNTLVAGQILWIRSGTFDWASLTSLPSGTEENRIKIAAYPGETPIGTLSASTVGFDDSYGFGHASGAAYWDLVGLTWTLAGRAGIIFGAQQWNNPAISCNNIRIIDCDANTTLAASDNGGILFFDSGADYWEVVRGTYTATGATGGEGTNRGLIWCDYTKHCKLIGVLLNADGTSLPYYFKHTNAQTASEVDRVIKNCIIRNGSRGMLLCGRYFQMTNNVIDACFVDFGDQGGGAVDRGYNNITHNTFRSSNIGFTINDTGGETWENVLLNCAIQGGELWDNPYTATDLLTESSYNAYSSGAGRIRRNGSTYSLAAYQAAFVDREINSIAGTITFEGGATPGDTPANWALATGSAGENAANDGTDMGVDASKLLTTDD